MAENSKIEWTNHTFNPWWGCTRISEGCRNCYAEALDARYNASSTHWGPSAERKPMSVAYWKQPVKWNREASGAPERPRVFCASMADVFEDRGDLEPHRERLWQTIRETPNLDWLLLTKRPENIAAMLPSDWGAGFANVWLGTTVENQEAANKRVRKLLEVSAAVRFLSCEPLLGPVDLTAIPTTCAYTSEAYIFNALSSELNKGLWFEEDGEEQARRIHWVIAGGESGPGARPMHPNWARSLRDQCEAAGVAFHFKQWGEHCPSEQSGHGYQSGHRLMNGESWAVGRNTHAWPDGYLSFRLGKKRAGRMLNGREHNGLPQALDVAARGA